MQDVRVEDKNCLHKIPLNKDFIRVKKEGFFCKKSGLVLRYIKGTATLVYCGVAASKFAYKRAVDRNYAKRRMRELLHHNPPQKPGYYLLTATSSSNKIVFEDLKNDYRQLLTKIPN